MRKHRYPKHESRSAYERHRKTHTHERKKHLYRDGAKKLLCIMAKNASWNTNAKRTSTGSIMNVMAANTGLELVSPAAITLASAPTMNAITIASANMPKLVLTFLTAVFPCGVALPVYVGY